MSAEAGPSQTRSTAFSRWRDSVADLTGLGLSDNQKSEAANAEAERQKMANDWDRCEEWKQKLMTQSPIVTFMLKHLELAGCKFTPASIQCYPCPEDLAAQSGFHPDYGVMLCQNRTHLPTKAYAESALTHELMHAFDYCRFKMDFNNVRHHACSEIRASNLSGECRWIREQQRKIYGFTKHHQACVKRRAATSIMNNPTFEGMDQQTKRAAAEKVVNEVWESCSKDTRPFDEIY